MKKTIYLFLAMLLANALTAQAYDVSIGTSTYGQVAYLSNFTESDLQGEHLYVPGYVKSGENWYPTIVSSSAINAMSTMWYVVVEYGCLGFGSYAVKNCPKLTHVILPSSVKFLADNFISNSGHPSNVLTLSLAGETAFSIGQQAFASINNTGLFIETSSRAAAQMWTDIFSDLTLPSGISATANFSWNSPAYDYTFNMTNGASLFFVVTTPPTATQTGESEMVGATSHSSNPQVAISCAEEDQGQYVASGLQKVYCTSVADGAFLDAGITGFYYLFNSNVSGTRIGKKAFHNDASINVVYTNAEVIDNRAFMQLPNLTQIQLPGVTSIGDSAFYCTNKNASATLKLSGKLKTVGKYAFDGAKVQGEVVLPYGITSLGKNAFANCSITRMLIPSSLRTCGTPVLSGNSTLSELLINRDFSSSGAFTTIPATCAVRVPVELLPKFKTANNWISRADYITGGAYDFRIEHDDTFDRYVTVTSTHQSTEDGITYAGTAAYVYQLPWDVVWSAFTFTLHDSETDNTYNMGTRYLMTEIGDSCFRRMGLNQGSNLTDMKHLEYIGRYAYYNSMGDVDLTIPSTVLEIGDYAFAGAWQNININAPATSRRYGIECFNGINDHNTGTCFVENREMANFQNAINGWDISTERKNTIWSNVTPFFVPDGESVTFSCLKDVTMPEGVKAYYVNAVNDTEAFAELISGAIPANSGTLLRGLTAGQRYTPTTTTGTPSLQGNQMVANTDAETLVVYGDAYLYNGDGTFNHRWAAATDEVPSGEACLIPSPTPASWHNPLIVRWSDEPQHQLGDVDGDGKVDVTDVNILVNIILGKDSAGNYDGGADVNGVDGVDVSDVNAVVNIILGKN